MRQGFSIVLFCGCLTLSGCASSSSSDSGSNSQTKPSISPSATTVLEPSIPPVDELQNCIFNGKELAGNVFFSDSQFGWDADVNIYESENPLVNDLRVYLEQDGYFGPMSCGQWKMVSSSWQADFIAYRTNSLFDADVTIYYVSDPWAAGTD